MWKLARGVSRCPSQGIALKARQARSVLFQALWCVWLSFKYRFSGGLRWEYLCPRAIFSACLSSCILGKSVIPFLLIFGTPLVAKSSLDGFV